MKYIVLALVFIFNNLTYANICSTNAREPQIIKVEQSTNGLDSRLHFEYCESVQGRCIQLGEREFYSMVELKLLEKRLRRNGTLKIAGHAGLILATLASGYFLIDSPMPTIAFGVASCAGTFLTVSGIGDIKKASILSKIDQDRRVANIQKFAHDLDSILRML